MIDLRQPHQDSIGVFGSDTPSIDAFGSFRTSQKNNRFDSEFIYDFQQDIVDIVENGSATVTHNASPRDLSLAVNGAGLVDAAVYSYPCVYTAGNSQAIAITAVPDLEDIGGGTMELFLRSSISGTATDLVTIPQSEWLAFNDRDWSKSHIFEIDFQSLKVGRVRFFLDSGGLSVKVGEIFNDNIRNSGYWQMPSLPAFVKIYNTGSNTIIEIGYGDDENALGFRYTLPLDATAAAKLICLTVKSESGGNLLDLPGFPRSVDNGLSSINVGNSQRHLLSIRPKSTFKTFNNLSIALLKSIELETDNPIYVEVYYGATLAGATWNNVDTNHSMMEYSTSNVSPSGNFRKVDSFYLGSGKNTQVQKINELGRSVLWSRKGTETGIFSILATRNSTSNANVFPILKWEEIR